MGCLEENLSIAKSLCENIVKNYHPYYQIYSFTTENISGYLKYFDLKNRSLLTVGSSGDQVLNAFYKGARDITLFDINPFAKYYTFLKIAGILSLDYIDFQNFFFKQGQGTLYNRNMYSSNLFQKIKPVLKSLDYESCYFFEELFNTYPKDCIRLCLFDDDESRNKVIKGFNNYLMNEITYNRLKKSLKDICFKYINGDIFKDEIPGKYDNIFLSNLCTITSNDRLIELLQKLDENNLNMNGKILFGYLWNINYHNETYSSTWKEIYKMPITKKVFEKYITEYHHINGSNEFLWNRKEKDLVLIYRKK